MIAPHELPQRRQGLVRSSVIRHRVGGQRHSRDPFDIGEYLSILALEAESPRRALESLHLQMIQQGMNRLRSRTSLTNDSVPASHHTRARAAASHP